jgi:hypothetical protein
MYGCELIDISKKITTRHINLTQDTPEGLVYLFMAEIDSSNSRGATALICGNDGKSILAIDKYEMYEEIERLKRSVTFNPVTKMRFDTLSDKKMKVRMEIDYFKNYSFIAEKLDSTWFISGYNFSSN